MTRMRIMGIINVTPDSFSDGGHYCTPEAVLAQTDRLIREGADLVDIGGESTRPFAAPVTEDEELRRVIPAIYALRQKYGQKDGDRYCLSISIDTSKAEVARQALLAGADIINDVSALRHDPAMINLVSNTSVPVILMHMQGTPGDMQTKPAYTDVVAEIIEFFRERLSFVQAHGVAAGRIILDPGLGFGKNLDHNLSILSNLAAFTTLGCPLLLGHSRKRFIGELTGAPLADRDLATAVVSALAVGQGVSIVRVHNVAATRQAIQIAEAIASPSSSLSGEENP